MQEEEEAVDLLEVMEELEEEVMEGQGLVMGVMEALTGEEEEGVVLLQPGVVQLAETEVQE
jgi:hypothetical protein